MYDGFIYGCYLLNCMTTKGKDIPVGPRAQANRSLYKPSSKKKLMEQQFFLFTFVQDQGSEERMIVLVSC